MSMFSFKYSGESLILIDIVSVVVEEELRDVLLCIHISGFNMES